MMRTSETDICVPTYTLNTLRVRRKRSRVRLFLAFFGLFCRHTHFTDVCICKNMRTSATHMSVPTYTENRHVNVNQRIRRKCKRQKRLKKRSKTDIFIENRHICYIYVGKGHAYVGNRHIHQKPTYTLCYVYVGKGHVYVGNRHIHQKPTYTFCYVYVGKGYVYVGNRHVCTSATVTLQSLGFYLYSHTAIFKWQNICII